MHAREHCSPVGGPSSGGLFLPLRKGFVFMRGENVSERDGFPTSSSDTWTASIYILFTPGISTKYKIDKQDIIGWWDENEHKCYEARP